jgi:hypothetical protein
MCSIFNKNTMPIVNKRIAEMLIVCLSCHFGMGKRYPVGVLNDTCMLTMTRTYLGPKLSSMIMVLLVLKLFVSSHL